MGVLALLDTLHPWALVASDHRHRLDGQYLRKGASSEMKRLVTKYRECVREVIGWLTVLFWTLIATLVVALGIVWFYGFPVFLFGVLTHLK